MMFIVNPKRIGQSDKAVLVERIREAISLESILKDTPDFVVRQEINTLNMKIAELSEIR